jgi:hypothetical protein
MSNARRRARKGSDLGGSNPECAAQRAATAQLAAGDHQAASNIWALGNHPAERSDALLETWRSNGEQLQTG